MSTKPNYEEIEKKLTITRINDFKNWIWFRIDYESMKRRDYLWISMSLRSLGRRSNNFIAVYIGLRSVSGNWWVRKKYAIFHLVLFIFSKFWKYCLWVLTWRSKDILCFEDSSTWCLVLLSKHCPNCFSLHNKYLLSISQ